MTYSLSYPAAKSDDRRRGTTAPAKPAVPALIGTPLVDMLVRDIGTLRSSGTSSS